MVEPAQSDRSVEEIGMEEIGEQNSQKTSSDNIPEGEGKKSQTEGSTLEKMIWRLEIFNY